MIANSPHDPGLKAYLLGTHRTRSPVETLSQVEPFLNTFGITRIANISGLDRTSLPVVAVCRPNARSSAVFHGKGVDLVAAKTSGVMEAIEAWHAEHVDLPLRLGSVADLKAPCQLIDTEGLPRCPTSEFRLDLRMLWVQGTELTNGEPTWVPFELVHADGSMPPLPGSGCFATSTNGLASGNHILEATSHGLCELIERDATSLWNRMPRKQRDDRRVDIMTIEDQTCRDVLARFEHGCLDVAVWETTTEIGVAAFQCMAVDRTGEVPHVAYGAGCHPTRSIALFRALTEAAQVRLTYILGSREDLRHADYEPATLSAKASSARRLMCFSGRMRNFGSIRTHEFPTFEEEVAWLLSRLRGAGFYQSVVVDLTRPEFGLNVVRVLVPGLEGSDHHEDYVLGQRARALADLRI